MFRCLGFHFGANFEALEQICQTLKVKLEAFTEKNFDAELLEDLPKVKEYFNVGIDVYSLDNKKVAKVIRRTGNESKNTMHVNL